MYQKTYIFGSDIKNSDYYSDEKGYGFVDQSNVPGKTGSERSLYCGGWNLRESCKDEYPVSASSSQTGVYLVRSRHVLIFKATVPDYGAYKITISTTASSLPIKNMSYFAGRRNLLERDISVSAGETYSNSYYTYVSEYIPAMTSIPSTEKAVYISISGENAGISSLTIESSEVPTLFIAGDSTLTDQNALTPYYPICSCAGWAQVMPQYLKEMAVCNQAHSGMTTNCFRDDGHLAIIDSHIKPGDIFLMQFGHNDQKRRNLAAFGGYLDNLRYYVQWARSKGAFPIIVSPISRIPFEETTNLLGEEKTRFCSLLRNHALACASASYELQVPLIDLHSDTFSTWCKLGIEASRDYFCPGDITHTNDYGANLISSFVANEIKAQDMPVISKHLKEKMPLQLLPECGTKEYPIEPAKGNSAFTIEIPYVDIQGIPEFEDMKLALEKGLLDPCVMHLHPNDVMPRAQFLMVYLRALRLAGKRPYDGLYTDMDRYEWDSSFVQTCIEENLIDPSTTPHNKFRPNDALTNGEFASFVIRGMKDTSATRNLPFEVCYEDAKKIGLLGSNADIKCYITRAQCYKGLVVLCNLLDTGNKALPSDAEIHPIG